ncbi:MAG TPA: trigger factor [Chthoniobacteraceae bacterium]|jgi:trigger factor|nr:trigger factor [Chthoniobacteraceae bacterium]
MNVVVEPLPNCLTTLRVEVEPEKVTEARAAISKEFGQSARIPGYRVGKAPLSVIERKFRKEIRAEVEKKVLGDSTRQAISEKGLRVLQLANIEDVKLAEDNSMSFTATVITQPDFVLPEYKGIMVEVHPTKVTDEEVDRSMEELREQAADFVDLDEDRGAEMEDFIVVNYSGTIDGQLVHELFPKAGKPLSGNDDFWIKMTEEAFFPGFCQSLVGARPGDVRTFQVEVPEDFPVEGMPGQKIDYEVTIRSIKKKVLPNLDDAFADTIVKGKTIDELRGVTRDQLERQHAMETDRAKRNQIMRHLLSWVECELPVNLVRQETQRILSDIVRENQARGVADEVLKESEKEIVGSAAQTAREKLKGTFILLRIAEKENLTVAREELFGRVATLAERYEMGFEQMLKELQKRGAIDQIQEEIVTAKALDFVVGHAIVTETARPAAAPAESSTPEPAAHAEPSADEPSAPESVA